MCRFTLFCRTSSRPSPSRLLVIATVLSAMTAVGSTTVRADEPSAPAAAIAMEKLVVDSIEKAEKSVVAIGLFGSSRGAQFRFDGGGRAARGERPDLDAIPDKYGTGVVIGENLILTNHHVVLNADPEATNAQRFATYIRVAGHAQWIRVAIKGADPRSDLAVLEIPKTEAGAPQLKPIEFAAKNNVVKKGQIVISLGNPYSIASDGDVSASWGIVANVNRRVAQSQLGTSTKLQHFGGLIQTDAKLNLGTSGGALINLRGKMIGLTTSLAATTGHETPAGYAVAVDDAFRRIVDTLREGKEVEHGLIGIYPTEQRTNAGAASQGVSVNSIILGVPANAILNPRDIITHVDGERVTHPTELMLAVGQRAAGAKVDLIYLQGIFGNPVVRQASIHLNKFPVRGAKVITNPRPSWRGLHVDYAQEVISGGMRQGFMDSESLLVTAVDPDSPAAEAGIEKGHLIREVDATAIASLKDAKIAIPENFLEWVANETGPVELTARPANPSSRFAKVTIAPTVEAESTAK